MPPVKQKATEMTVFEEIEACRQAAEEAYDEASNKKAEFDDANQRCNENLERIRELTDQLLAEDAPELTAPVLPTTRPVARPAARSSGPVRKTPAAPATPPQPKHGPRPSSPALAKKTSGTAAKPAPAKGGGTTRNYDNDTSLPETIWEVLDREPQEYLTVIPEYPDATAVGLKVSEIKDVIEAEKKWVSSSPNISPMIQSAVGDLRYEGKLARNEDDRRYYIIDGAELYGPPLNTDGSPMEEQEDGTFLKNDGHVFTDQQGRAIKKRKKKGE